MYMRVLRGFICRLVSIAGNMPRRAHTAPLGYAHCSHRSYENRDVTLLHHDEGTFLCTYVHTYPVVLSCSDSVQRELEVRQTASLRTVNTYGSSCSSCSSCDMRYAAGGAGSGNQASFPFLSRFRTLAATPAEGKATNGQAGRVRRGALPRKEEGDADQLPIVVGPWRSDASLPHLCPPAQ